MNLNEVQNLRELLSKINRYKIVLILMLILLPTTIFFWETNKEITYQNNLRIYPISIVDFEKNYSKFSFNKNGNTMKKNVDSLYSLKFSPLSFLFAYKQDIQNTILNEENKKTKYKKYIKDTKIIFDNSNSLHTLEVRIISKENKKNTNEYLLWLLNNTDQNLKNNFNIALKNQLEISYKKFNAYKLQQEKNLNKINELKIDLESLETLIEIIPKLKFVSFHISDLKIIDNKFDRLKLVLLSIAVSISLSVSIIIFLPNKK